MHTMLSLLFHRQKELLDAFFARLDVEACEKTFEVLTQTQGVFFFTGVGKSGFVAQKVAATLMSTGTKAFYLPPVDALHGDLAMVSKNDVVCILSKSGETEELLHLLPFVRSKGAQLVAITSNNASRLVRGCDLSFHLPCDTELCLFDLAPTISTEIQLLFGDVLAMALMRKKGISMEEFARNHPGGRIGKRSLLKVRDLMLDTPATPLCHPHHLLEEVLIDFSSKRCGCLIVVDEKMCLKGVFTDGDLRRSLEKKGEKVLKEALGNLMTPSPKKIDPDSLAWEAMQFMEADQKRPITILPVTEGDKVIGVLKLHDLIQAGL